MSDVNFIEIDDVIYDLPFGASAVVEGDNLIINNGNVNGVKSSQLVTETMTITTNQYGWIYFPENLLVINASISDMYKKLVLVKYDRTNSYQYIAASYLETNGVISYTKLTANKSYEVTYTYLKDVPISTGHRYSTEEKVVGTWIDGKPIYEKTFLFPSQITASGNTWIATNIDNTNIKKIINSFGLSISNVFPIAMSIGNTNDGLQFMHFRNTSIYIDGLIYQYIKD